LSSCLCSLPLTVILTPRPRPTWLAASDGGRDPVGNRLTVGLLLTPNSHLRFFFISWAVLKLRGFLRDFGMLVVQKLKNLVVPFLLYFSMPPKISIIYLSYNVRNFLDEVLVAWEKVEYPRESWEIIIVDNASPDGSVDLIREKVLPKSGITLPKVTLITNEVNSGFADGNRVGYELAVERGADYVFLENNDAKLTPRALAEAVALAESDPQIASVQSLMLLWQNHEIVNSSGGVIQFLGFGFVRDNGKKITDCHYQDGEEINYGSGAAVLYRVAALQKVGFLDSFLFLYHEDLDLGWRLRLAGYKNVLSTKSIVYHYYEFKRSISKFFWMERNRILVHVAHLKIPTLILLTPFLLVMELALLLLSIKGGWLKDKLKVYSALLSPHLWKHLWKKRRASQKLRTVSDREIVRLWSAKIEHQETSSWLVERIGNPSLCLVWLVLKKIIIW